MTVVQLQAASLDKSASLETEGTGGTSFSSPSSSASSSSSSSTSSSSSSSSVSSASSDISTTSSSSSSSSHSDQSIADVVITKSSTDAGEAESFLQMINESTSDGDDSKMTKSTFNILDTIKRSSNKINQEFKKRFHGRDKLNPASSVSSASTSHGMTFTSITESLSVSSEEISEAMSKTLAILQDGPTERTGEEDNRHTKPSAYEWEDDESYVFEQEKEGEDNEWSAVAFPSYKSKQEPLVNRIEEEPDDIIGTVSSESSHSEQSSDDDDDGQDDSDIEDQEGQIGLVTRTYAQDHREDQSESSNTNSLIESDTEDSRTLCSVDSAYLEDFSDEVDALETLGSVILQIGTCNFDDMVSDFVGEDESSLASNSQAMGQTEQQHGKKMSGIKEHLQSFRSSLPFAETPPPAPTQTFSETMATPTGSRNRSFIEALFSCNPDL